MSRTFQSIAEGTFAKGSIPSTTKTTAAERATIALLLGRAIKSTYIKTNKMIATVFIIIPPVSAYLGHQKPHARVIHISLHLIHEPVCHGDIIAFF